MRYFLKEVKENGASDKVFVLFNEFTDRYEVRNDVLKDALASGYIEVPNLKLSKSGVILLNKDFKDDVTEIRRCTSICNSTGNNSKYLMINIRDYSKYLKDAIHDGATSVSFSNVTNINSYIHKVKTLGGKFEVLIGSYENPELIRLMLSNKCIFVSSKQIIFGRQCVEMPNYLSSVGMGNKVNIDITGLHIDQVSDISYYFSKGAYKDIKIINANLQNVKYAEYLFCDSYIDNVVINNVYLNNLKSAKGMFYHSVIENLTLTNINIESLEDFESLFESACIGNLYISNIIAKNPKNFRFAFKNARLQGFNNIKEQSSIDNKHQIKVECMDAFNTNAIETMQSMFENSKLPYIDLHWVNNSQGNLLDISKMFKDCEAISVDVSGLNFDTIANTQNAFQSLLIANVKINNVVNTTVNKSDVHTKNKSDSSNKKSTNEVYITQILIERLNKKYNTVLDRPLEIVKYFKPSPDRYCNRIINPYDRLSTSKWSLRFKKVSSIKEIKHKGIKIENIANNVYLHVDESKNILTVISEKDMYLGGGKQKKENDWCSNPFAATRFYSIDFGDLEVVKYDANGCPERYNNSDIVQKCVTHKLIIRNKDVHNIYLANAFNDTYTDELDISGTNFAINTNIKQGVTYLPTFVGTINVINSNLASWINYYVIPEPKINSLEYRDRILLAVERTYVNNLTVSTEKIWSGILAVKK